MYNTNCTQIWNTTIKFIRIGYESEDIVENG